MKHWIGIASLLGGAIVGLIVAQIFRAQINPQPGISELQPNVWTVVAVPLGALLGAVLTRQYRRWNTAAWIAIIYVVSIFGAARIERLIKGAAEAAENGHQLYFLLVPWLQIAAIIGLGFTLARPRTTRERKEPSYET